MPLQLHAVTGGNPFFVHEVLRVGEARAAVPASVVESVLARLDRLDDAEPQRGGAALGPHHSPGPCPGRGSGPRGARGPGAGRGARTAHGPTRPGQLPARADPTCRARRPALRPTIGAERDRAGGTRGRRDVRPGAARAPRGRGRGRRGRRAPRSTGRTVRSDERRPPRGGGPLPRGARPPRGVRPLGAGCAAAGLGDRVLRGGRPGSKRARRPVRVGGPAARPRRQAPARHRAAVAVPDRLVGRRPAARRGGGGGGGRGAHHLRRPATARPGAQQPVPAGDARRAQPAGRRAG